MRKYITALVFCLIQVAVLAQEKYEAEKFQAALMQTSQGAKVVYTGTKHSFTIDIIGKLTPSEEPNFVTVDGHIMQSSTIPFQAKLDFDNLSIESQKKNLQAHMDYEMKYVRDQLKSDDLHEKSEFITLGNKVFLCWSYDMPASFNSIDKQYYLTTICFDQILVLNAPVPKGTKAETIRKLLIDTGHTLKTNNEPIDLEKLYKELNPK